MSQAFGSFKITKTVRSTVGAILGEAVGCEILGHDGYPAEDALLFSIMLIWTLVWVQIFLDEVDMLRAFHEGRLNDVEHPVSVPSGRLDNPNDGSGSGDTAVGREDKVLVTREAAAQEYTIAPAKIKFVPLFLGYIPEDLLCEFADALLNLSAMQPSKPSVTAFAQYVFA